MPEESAGSLSLDRRLERIETMLAEIDHKLDRKVEVERFLAVENRLRDIELRGTSHAQAALSSVESLEARLDKVEREAASKEAVESYRRWLYGGGAVAALFLAANLVLNVITFVRAFGVH